MNYTTRPCNAIEFTEQWFTDIAGKFGYTANYHRKLWEWCAIAKAVDDILPLNERGKALGFGVGLEFLPSYFANTFQKVVATDLSLDNPQAKLWKAGAQHSSKLQEIYQPQIFNGEFEKFSEIVAFDELDMNAIPEKYCDESFDITWSSCTFEHLGSIKQGADFIKNQMRCLKKGGIAIHTTELNCNLNENRTFPDGATVIFNRSDIDKLFSDLTLMGHSPFPAIYDLGNLPQDQIIDVPPYSTPHLKLRVGEYVTTSIILIIKK